MIDKEIVNHIVGEWLVASDSYLVDVKVLPGNTIVVEIDNDDGVKIDECAELSRYIELQLDRDKEDFEIEVGSTGISAPFTLQRHYLKNLGNEVECLTKNSMKRKGILKSADERSFIIEVEKQIRPEGAKRKKTIAEEESYQYDEIKYVKRIIRV
ncbi:MAG: ribosome assembly cofactor RimP [Tannerellaceae bacterium]|jgi:ribosome maturation factor RimP|nr:ribosome assembly cofactor RimP [Tannerellaceae bacterium]